MHWTSWLTERSVLCVLVSWDPIFEASLVLLLNSHACQNDKAMKGLLWGCLTTHDLSTMHIASVHSMHFQVRTLCVAGPAVIGNLAVVAGSRRCVWVHVGYLLVLVLGSCEHVCMCDVWFTFFFHGSFSVVCWQTRFFSLLTSIAVCWPSNTFYMTKLSYLYTFASSTHPQNTYLQI